MKYSFIALMLLLFVLILAGILYSHKYYVRTYSWNYGGHSYNITLEIDKELFDYYKDYRRDLYPTTYAGEDSAHPYLADVAAQLYEPIKNMGYSDDQIAEYLLQFCHSFEYVIPEPNVPQHPIITLVNSGDCECLSDLYAALLTTLGIKAILIRVPTHQACGVALNNPKGPGFYLKGQYYSYAELTDPHAQIGELPELVQQSGNLELYAVPRTAVYYRYRRRPVGNLPN